MMTPPSGNFGNNMTVPCQDMARAEAEKTRSGRLERFSGFFLMPGLGQYIKTNFME
jgi:hypothetical protein